MPEKKSAVEVLRVLVERVRRIERDAGQIAAVLDRMIELQPRRQGEPVSGEGSEPVAAPVAS
jgi:hypothetical protein